MKGLNSGEMNQPNSEVARDMAFGQLLMITSTPDADMKQDVDYTIGTLNISYRRRKPSIKKYGEISIRNDRVSGAKTQRQKILDGECKSPLFVFEFPDAWVVCTRADILVCLRADKGYVKANNDGQTSAYYISIEKIAHLLIDK